MIIGAQHLNRSRLTGQAYAPEPTEGDVRGSGSIFNLCDVMLSVYLHEREENGVGTGNPGEDATINCLKAKDGVAGQMAARFNGPRMRFELPQALGSVGTVAA